MSHTPAPWSLPHFASTDIACKCRSVLAEGYMGAIASVGVRIDLPLGEGGNDNPPLEEAISNAYLIHAAPDLLLAAEEALRLIDWLDLIAKPDCEIYRHEIASQAEMFRRRIAPAVEKAQP